MNAPILLNTRGQQNAAMRQVLVTEDLYDGGALIGRAGQTVTLSVLPSDTGDQLRVIDNYISGYKNFGFVADLLSPVVLVDQEAGNRIDRSANSAFQLVDTLVGR